MWLNSEALVFFCNCIQAPVISMIWVRILSGSIVQRLLYNYLVQYLIKNGHTVFPWSRLRPPLPVSCSFSLFFCLCRLWSTVLLLFYPLSGGLCVFVSRRKVGDGSVLVSECTVCNGNKTNGVMDLNIWRECIKCSSGNQIIQYITPTLSDVPLP